MTGPMRIFLTTLLIACGIFSTVAVAVQPDEMLDNPVLEMRARAISQGLRCLVCQNESIDDSNAGLARDLRLLVRERLMQGDTDDQVVAFIVARYGDFVLLRPPVQVNTIVLWFGPLLVLCIGGVSIFVFLRKAKQKTAAFAADLTQEERAKVKNIVEQTD